MTTGLGGVSSILINTLPSLILIFYKVSPV